MQILLMEDDERIVRFLKRGLEAENHTVVVALTKDECLNLLTHHSFDAMIIDIFLGEYNGINICQALRDSKIATPILLMTAKDSPEMKAASHQAGANAYLPKPFSFDTLLEQLGSLRAASSFALQW